MKKVISIILALAMVFSMAACGNIAGNGISPNSNAISTERGKYPVDFDFTLLYKSVDEFNADYEKYLELIKEYDNYRGTLVSADNILKYLDFYCNGEAGLILDKLDMYVNAGLYIFPGDNSFKTLEPTLYNANDEWDKHTEFLYEEILSLPKETRLAIFSDARLAPYERYFPEFWDPEAYYDDSDSDADYSYLYSGRAESLYNTFLFSNFVGPEFEMPDGTIIEMTEQDYESIWYGDYDRETKLAAYNAWWDAIANYADTLAYIYENYMLETYSTARSLDYETTEEYSMDINELPLDMADRIIDVCEGSLDKAVEIYSTYGKAATDDKYYIFDFADNLSPYSPGAIEYDDAVDNVMEALSPLGDDYINHFKKIINSGFIDVFPKEGKSGGAFQSGGYIGLSPYIMFNYSGDERSVDTIAHEMGHAVYSEYSRENQSYFYLSPVTFTQEIASTTNEYIYFNYMINNAKSDEEKLYYIEANLREFMDATFHQCLYEEMEQQFYDIIEAGEYLDPERCCCIYEDLCEKYFGPDFTAGESGRNFWATQDHYFAEYYVFKYATSACYAAYLASKICEGDSAMLEKYIDFLKLGCSKSPAELLETLGIDIESNECFEYAMGYFENLANQMLELNAKVNGAK